jgi:uncharacterized spore protein YtfJ
MKPTAVLLALLCASAAFAQTPTEKPAAAPAPQSLAASLAERLGRELHAKTFTGDPIKAGAVTLIPILAVDINFAGGAPAAPNAPAMDAFLMTGEARPVGFVAITPKGTRFIPVDGAAVKEAK